MTQELSKNIFAMAKDEYLGKDDLIKVIRKYNRCKDESEKDTLRDVIVKNNMRLVIKIARRYAARYNQNPDDLFQNGVIGILVALDKFKPNKRFAFTTYAYFWIEQLIQRACADDKMINTHRYLSVGVGKAPIYFKAFAKADGDMSKFSELLRKGGVTRKEQDRIEHVIAMNQDSSFVDIHGTVGSQEDDARFIDVIEDKNAIPPDVQAIDNVTREKLLQCIEEHLTPIEREVIKELYFLSQNRNISEASKKIKKSKPFVMSTERKAIKKIAKFMKGEKAFVKSLAVDSFEKAWEQITSGEYKAIIQKTIRENDPQYKEVWELPLKKYSCTVGTGVGTLYEVMAPTARGAVGFLREKTSKYFDIKIFMVNGEPFTSDTPSAFFRDFKKSEKARIREEINACRWC